MLSVRIAAGVWLVQDPLDFLPCCTLVSLFVVLLLEKIVEIKLSLLDVARCACGNVRACGFQAQVRRSELIICISGICNFLDRSLRLHDVLMPHLPCSLRLCNERAVLTLLILEHFRLCLNHIRFLLLRLSRQSANFVVHTVVVLQVLTLA